MTSIEFAGPAPAVAAGLSDRSVTGVALPYREIGNTSAGAVSVAAGAVRMPADLSHIKLFSDHGRSTPVGYATAADDSPDRLVMTFYVAGTPAGDTALLEAAEHVRDALSVELSDVTIKAGVITSAVLDAVALVPLPAYRSARLVLAADTDPDAPADDVSSPPAGAPADSVTVTQSAEPSTPSADDDPDADDTEPKENAMPDLIHPPAPPSSVAAARSGPSLSTVAGRINQVIRGASDAAQVNAALTDIIPANDPADAYLRQQWVDELWTPYIAEQFLTSSVNNAALTGSKVVGWRWKTTPVVGPYTGNKTPVPSSPALLEPAEAPVYRIAGGWDIDRIFADLGESDFAGAVLDAAAIDATRKVETAVATAILGAATQVDTTGLTDPFAVIAAVVGEVIGNGAAATFIAVAPDVFSTMLGVAAVDAPWWLTAGAGGTVSIAGQTGSIADLRFGVSAGLVAGQVVAGDRRALTHYTTPNIRVQALNIPNGGIDVGLFLYCADLVHNAAGLAMGVVAP